MLMDFVPNALFFSSFFFKESLKEILGTRKFRNLQEMFNFQVRTWAKKDNTSVKSFAFAVSSQ